MSTALSDIAVVDAAAPASTLRPALWTASGHGR